MFALSKANMCKGCKSSSEALCNEECPASSQESYTSACKAKRFAAFSLSAEVFCVDIDDFVEKCVKDIKGEMKASNFELYINVESAGYERILLNFSYFLL